MPHAPARLWVGKGGSGSGSQWDLGLSLASPAGCEKGTAMLPAFQSPSEHPSLYGKSLSWAWLQSAPMFCFSFCSDPGSINSHQHWVLSLFQHFKMDSILFVSSVGLLGPGMSGLWGFSEDTVAAGRGQGCAGLCAAPRPHPHPRPRGPEAGPAPRLRVPILCLDTHSGPGGAC